MSYRAVRLVAASVIAAALLGGTATAAEATPTPLVAVTPSAVVASGDGWLVVGSGLRTGGTAEGVSRAGGAGINCGWVTCTLYIYRGTTRSIDAQVSRYQNASTAAIAGAFAVACVPIGGVGAVVCAAIGAVVGSYAIDQFNYAAGHNQCIGIKFTGIPPSIVPIGISPNNGQYCHN